jgi:nicotinate-nucleotide adenylyltransferase
VAGLRLGIFGGTFDPPHLGHLILAAEAVEQLRLDRVLWVITPDPPHKLGQTISPLLVRLELLEAALAEEERFQISRVDIDRPGPQYAVDTVRILARQFPSAQLVYLLGGDSLRDLPTWFDPRGLLAEISSLGVMRRPGARIDLAGLEIALPGIGEKTKFFDTPLIEISSSNIRARVRAGRPYQYFLPTVVYRLILENGWYQEL